MLRCPRSVSLYYTLVFLLEVWLTSLSNVGQAFAAPVYVHSKVAGDGIMYEESKSLMEPVYFPATTLATVGVLVCLVLCVVLCIGGCCENVFGKREDADVQTGGFSSPMTELRNTSSTSSSNNDRGLEMGQIEFEPIPKLQELTPTSNCSNNNNYCRDGSASKSLGVVSPCTKVASAVSTDGANIYDHDWFEEPCHNFPRTHIEYVQEVGKGWFGPVIESQAEDIVPYVKKLRVMVKVLREDSSGQEQMRFLEESRLYRVSNHENILKLCGHSTEKLPFLLAMEYCPQGDLKSFLCANVSRAEMLNSQGALLRMALDIAKGLNWMSTSGFIHQDLAARNCQVGSEERIKIGDYGLSVQNFPADYYWCSNVPIPLRWSAPETLQRTLNAVQTLKVLKSSNVWTYGVVMWEIFEFGKLPYSDLSDGDVISRVVIDRNYTLGQISRPGFVLKDDIYRIMLSCWNPQHDLRPCISSLVEELDRLSRMAISGKLHSQHIMEQRSPSWSNKDNFDLKWDEFAEKVNSPQNCEETPELNWQTPSINVNSNQVTANEKENVSFVDLEDVILSVEMDTKVSTVKHDEARPHNGKEVKIMSKQYTNSLMNLHVLALDSSSELSVNSTNSNESLISNDKKVWGASRDPEIDPWRKQIDLEKVPLKVRDESRNFQSSVEITRAAPNDINADYNLLTANHSGQSTADSTSGSVSMFDVTSRVVETNVQGSGSGCNLNYTPNVEGLEVTSKKLSVGSEEIPFAGVNMSYTQMSKSMSMVGSSQYNGDTSSLCNSSSSEPWCADSKSASYDSTVLPFSSKTMSLTGSHLPLHSVSKKPSTPESVVTAPTCSSYPSKVDKTSHDKTVDELLDFKTNVDTAPIPTESKPAIVLPEELFLSLNERLSSHVAPAITLSVPEDTTATVAGTHKDFPTSQQSVNTWVKGSRANIHGPRKVYNNFRNTKTSTPNFSPISDDTQISLNSSFFVRDDDVFEDFSMEINEEVSPISKNATKLYSTMVGCTGDLTNGSRNVLMGPSEDLGVNEYQRVTNELVSESTSTGGSDSLDFFESFRELEQPVASSNVDEIGADQSKSGFQDIFGRGIAVGTPYELGIYASATNHSSQSTVFPVARRLNFESDATDPSGKSSEGSHTIVNQTVGVNELTLNQLNESTKFEESFVRSPTFCKNLPSSSETLGIHRLSNMGAVPTELVSHLKGSEALKLNKSPVEVKNWFVEDIESAADEMQLNRSFYVANLDEESTGISVIYETREDDDEPFHLDQLEATSLNPAINLFENPDKLNKSKNSLNAEIDHNVSLGICEQSELSLLTSEWDLTTDNSVLYATNIEGKESKNDEEEKNKHQDFFHVKGNQNLTPVMPSMKSPGQKESEEAQHEFLDLRCVEKRTSSKKKSVSFDNKTIKLVYEYSPPPLPPRHFGSVSKGDSTKQSAGKLQQADSGVGASINVSLFNTCNTEVSRKS